MLIFPLGALCGLAIGRARGGRLRGLAELRFHAPLLLCLAFLVHAGLGVLPAGRRPLAIGFAYAAVGVWLVANARLHHGPLRLALALLAAGWLSNVIPMLLNGGMPVSLDGLRSVGAPATISVTEGQFYKHVPAGGHTVLPELGDVIPVRPLASVISIGDIVMFVGLVVLVVSAMTRQSPVSGSRSLPDRWTVFR